MAELKVTKRLVMLYLPISGAPVCPKISLSDTPAVLPIVLYGHRKKGETMLSEQDRKTIREHARMRWGLIPAIVWPGLAVAIFFAIQSFNLRFLAGWVAHTYPGTIGIPAFETALIMFLLQLTKVIKSTPREWIRQYWQRNFLGYHVAFWLEQKELKWELIEPGRWLQQKDRVIIAVALGGWFNYSRVYIEHMMNVYAGDDTWFVKARRSSIQPWLPWPGENAFVWLSDQDGNRISMPMEEALILLEEFYNVEQSNCKHGRVNSLSKIFRIMSEERGEGKLLNEVKRQRDVAIDALDREIDRITKTNRRRYLNTEGAKLHTKELITTITCLLPQDDSRLPKYKEIQNTILADREPVES